ncbi:MAG TPA: L-threonylcarbamoyladenylate synthase [Ktedonobacterales bacterium]|nr:L-threonylcarbamoyladenylate synthase [Ktedonobacterales bacterium]
MTERRTLTLAVSPEGEPAAHIAQAAALLRAGKLVAFPTETVYGLGADATNPAAVESIFAAKERPYSDPLIVHIPDATGLNSIARDIPPVAWELARRFWPGPLTLVLPRAERIPPVVAAGGDTVGVRAPSHPVAQALLRAAGVPIAAPSANRFMRTSPTAAAHVLEDLDGRIDCVLDGGPCGVGVESSVLDLTTDPPRLLRPGAVTLEQLRAILPATLGPGEHGGARGGAHSPLDSIHRAPGQLERHYAPRARLVVYDATGAAGAAAVLAAARAALAAGAPVGALAPDEEAPALEALGVVVARLGPADDPAEAARRLYAGLRWLDERGRDPLLAHTWPRAGLGLALWDRLRRAAGGRLATPGAPPL